MSWLEYRFAPRGRFRSPIAAGTLFGQLVWAARWSGADVGALLAPFREQRPPFLLSDACPLGHLPVPHLDPRKRSRRELDWLERHPYLPSDAWLAAARAGWNRLPTDDTTLLDGEAFVQREITTRVQIERGTGRALDGALFAQAAWVHRGEWVIYVVERDQTARRDWPLEAWLNLVGLHGYGGGASVSGGHWTAGRLVERASLGLDDGDGWCSLSAFAPLGLNLGGSRYELEVQRGRIGAQMSGAPWKHPYARIRAGAVFRGSSDDVAGGWVDDLARLDDGTPVGDYAFAFPVRLNP